MKIKSKNKLIVILVVLQLILLVSPVLAVPPVLAVRHNFGISGVGDMPTVGCSSSRYDDLLYYGGIAAGVDPVMLKVISRKETSCGANIKTNVNDNGTTDSGLMQINSGGFSALKLNSSGETLTPQHVESLNSDHVMSVWAATEVLKWKLTSVDNMVRNQKVIGGQKTAPNAFNLLWAYNGYSEKGLEYAQPVNEWYSENTKLAKMDSSGNVYFRDAVSDASSMTFEEFKERLEDVSSGKIDINNYVPRENYGEVDDSHETPIWEKESNVDVSTGTGVVGEETPDEVVANYTAYRFVKNIVKVINFVVQILSYVALIALLLLWTSYVLAKSGLGFVENWIARFTDDRIVASDPDSLMAMVKITLSVILIISIVLTGYLSSLIERAILAFLSAIMKAL